MGFPTARRMIKERCFPLTPALSPSEGERGNLRQLFGEPGFLGSFLFLLDLLTGHEPPTTSPSPWPLPAMRGEGGRRPGEGRENCGASADEWRFRGLFGSGF